jgi:GNAT superfamily N-acetyltransferase
MTLRPMTEQDLDGVLAVQAACYPAAMQEAAAVVLARLRTAPATTLVASDFHGVCAYGFAYPSRLGRVTRLNAGFTGPADADTLYVHDLAVHPRAHGQGLGRRLAQALFGAARSLGLVHGALVAVLDARPFWEKLGFAAAAPGEGGAGLATYPGQAVYMCRRVGACDKTVDLPSGQ